MKISRRFTAVLGAAAAIALPVAAQAQVTYFTTGVFTSNGLNHVSDNGMAVTFHGLGSTSLDTPSNASFGFFQTTGERTVGSGSFSDTFTLNVFQTSPTSGQGAFVGSFNGTVNDNSSLLYWVPSGPTTFNIDPATYSLFTNTLNRNGTQGYAIVAEDNNGGVTSVQGFISTPEPSSMALLGTGLVGLVPMVRRRTKK